MANKPIPTPLTADLPTNWTRGQIVAPTGQEVGLPNNYGYNYLMAKVNEARTAINTINDAFTNLPDANTLAQYLKLTKISRYKQSLYQDWKDGEITQQDYRDMKADYERQTIALTDVLARLNAERAELANGVKSEHPALVAFTKHQNIDQLSRELLVELIDHIKVYENGNISVRFKFADEFRRIAEYIEINTTKPAVAG